MGTMESDSKLLSDHLGNPLERPEIGRKAIVESSLAQPLEEVLALFGGQCSRASRRLAMPQSTQAPLLVGGPPFMNRLARHTQLPSNLSLRSPLFEQSDAGTSPHLQCSKVSSDHQSSHAELYHTPPSLSSYL